MSFIVFYVMDFSLHFDGWWTFFTNSYLISATKIIRCFAIGCKSHFNIVLYVSIKSKLKSGFPTTHCIYIYYIYLISWLFMWLTYSARSAPHKPARRKRRVKIIISIVTSDGQIVQLQLLKQNGPQTCQTIKVITSLTQSTRCLRCFWLWRWKNKKLGRI